MKYREISSHLSGAKEIIATIMLKDGVIEYEGISDEQREIWESEGIRVFGKDFKPQEDPEGFLKWLHMENSSYSKTSPIYDDGEE
jgi:hypothetical protein